MKIYQLDYTLKMPEYGIGHATLSSTLDCNNHFGFKRSFGSKEKAEELKRKLFEAGAILNINSYIDVTISEVELEE